MNFQHISRVQDLLSVGSGATYVRMDVVFDLRMVAEPTEMAGGLERILNQKPTLGCPGQEVNGSMVIGSMGYFTPIYSMYK